MLRPLRTRAVILLVVALAVVARPSATSAQAAPPPAGSAQPAALYTAAQAEAGKTIFEGLCAKCHLPDLSGKDDAPPLSGKYFASSWGGHKVSELFDFVKSNMPFDAPGTLDEQTYLNAVAYILSRNGVPAGETPLAKGDGGVIPVPKG